MKLAVIGASGKTAAELIHQAVGRGYEVVAIDREGQKGSSKKLGDKNLHVVTLKKYTEADFKHEFMGCDAVIFCLEHTTGPFTQVTIFSETMREVVPAMRAAGIKRLVAVTSRCTKSHPRHPLYHEWILRPLILGRALADMLRMETYLQVECSDINYTVVKPPQLKTMQRTDIYGENLIAAEGEFIRRGRFVLSRSHLAKFMLDCPRLSLWDRKLVAIALPS